MIASSSLQIHSNESGTTLHLAPYGTAELKAVQPIDAAGLAYPKGDLQALSTYSPAEMIEATCQGKNFISWGMYASDVRPSQFIGVVNLSEAIGPGDVYTKEMQSIGTFIMRHEWRGQGHGSLAKLALMAYALQSNTKIIESLTSEHNMPAQKSLEKVGFTLVDTFDYLDYPNGEKTQQWLFSEPALFPTLASAYGTTELKFYEAWKRYQRAAGKVTILTQ